MKTKLIICIFLTILVAFAFSPFEAEAVGTTENEIATEEENQIVITKHRSEESEQFLWDALMKYTDNNELLTTGILAVFKRESGYRSDAVCNWYLFTEKDICTESVEKIDAGLADGSTRDTFINNCHNIIGGFGLMQIWSEHQAGDLYDFAQEWGTSIADAEMQCAFTVLEFEKLFPKQFARIRDEITDPYSAGKMTSAYLDGAKPISQEVAGSYAIEIYKKYKSD